jgi:mono/diheme cytochrome c family protein
MLRCVMLALLFISSTTQAKDPQFIFMMECQGCHLADGRGAVNAVPSMNDEVAKFLTVPGGREFLAQVPGVAKSPLNDAEITAVLNWSLNEFGPVDIAARHPPYTVEEISRLRKTPLLEVKQARAALINLIEAQQKL